MEKLLIDNKLKGNETSDVLNKVVFFFKIKPECFRLGWWNDAVFPVFWITLLWWSLGPAAV